MGFLTNVATDWDFFYVSSRTASLSLGAASASSTSLNSHPGYQGSDQQQQHFRAQRSQTQAVISRSQSVMVAAGTRLKRKIGTVSTRSRFAEILLAGKIAKN